ncbi:MAG: response regulator [Candidatus Omnitrophica bacterium]|nr:response regulator [Candidatus Omnitrophota bacterium]
MVLEKVTLLIVEDNDADFRLVAEYLKESPLISFEIVRATRLSDAIIMLSENKIDAALLDLDLPDSKGLSIIEKIYNHDQGIAILVVTGLDDEKLGIEAVKKGAQDYLVKGAINGELLYRSIRYAVERKRAEKALHESEDRLKFALKASHTGAWDLDLIDHTAVRSIEHDRIFGYNELLPLWTYEMFREHVLPEDREIVDSKFMSAIENKTDWNFECRIRRVDGKERWIWAVGRHHSDAFGRVRRMAGIVQDITERKLAEEILKRDKETFERLVQERTKDLVNAQVELERAKRLSDIGVLAATVAHELRNPLAAIAMASANIQRKAKDASSLEGHFQVIEKKVFESDQIINNLLFYSRLRKPDLKKVDIYSILEECVDHAEKQSQNKIVFTKKFDSIKNIFIEADTLQIQETFSNLLNNARDAINSGTGVIEINASHDSESVKVIIKDNGSGIAEEDLAHIFDPFFTTKAKGTGLGLTVCYQIMKMHGGSIGFKSEKDQGTAVELILSKKGKNA